MCAHAPHKLVRVHRVEPPRALRGEVPVAADGVRARDGIVVVPPAARRRALRCVGTRAEALPQRAQARPAGPRALLSAELAQAVGDGFVWRRVGAETGEKGLRARAGEGLLEDLAGRGPALVIRDSHPVRTWRWAGGAGG